MYNFETYLNQKGFSAKTCRQYARSAEIFALYTDKSPSDITYQDLLAYVSWLQTQGREAPYINAEINRINRWFAYLQSQNPSQNNPAEGLIIRGTRRRLPHNLLEYQDLLDLLENFQGKPEYKLILSLMVFQALHPCDFPTLQSADFDLKTARLSLPGSAKTQARILPLDASQILPLHEHLEERSAPPFAEASKLRNQIQRLMKHLRKLHPSVRNSLQIRASVITWWLKSEDLRTVQYKAGHRYVGSTERYQTRDLDKLQEDLEKYHPLAPQM